jgi:hypothetical protein
MDQNATTTGGTPEGKMPKVPWAGEDEIAVPTPEQTGLVRHLLSALRGAEEQWLQAKWWTFRHPKSRRKYLDPGALRAGIARIQDELGDYVSADWSSASPWLFSTGPTFNEDVERFVRQILDSPDPVERRILLGPITAALRRLA